MFLRTFRTFQITDEFNRFAPLAGGFVQFNENVIDLGGSDPGAEAAPIIRPDPSNSTATQALGTGDFVTNNELLPYIREQRIFFAVNGLRPGVTVHAFFDNQLVDSSIIPARRAGTGTLTQASFELTGVEGDALVVGSDGALYGAFNIPINTFFAGDRELLIIDVTDLASRSAATTEACVTFHGFNFMNVPQAPAPDPTPPTVARTTRSTTRRVDTRGGRDPLSQTFFVSSDVSRGDEGIYVTKVDLYFAAKSADLGITIELRNVEGGFPKDAVLPFSRVHLNSADISVSSTAAIATTITFDGPVFLRSGEEYAIAIIPDGSNPDYRLWTSEVGGTDVLNSAASVVENWGEGTLFFSTNGTAWTPVQGEDLKFTLYRAQFNQETGSSVLVNKDYEFFTTGTANGTFEHGELAFTNTAIAQAGETINLSTTSANVTGTDTSFDTEFATDDYLVVQGNTTQGFDIIQVAAITNSTVMTLKGFPTYANTVAEYFIPANTRVGKVDHRSSVDTELFLIDSNASGSNVFANSDIIKSISGGEATITTVDDLSISRFQPLLQRYVINGTNLSFTRDSTIRGGGTQTGVSVELGLNNLITNQDIVVKSKSNEGGTKSFKINANFATSREADGVTVKDTISPILNMCGTSIKAFTNIINNDSTGENGLNGNSLTKYISKRVQLAEGQDAEDIRVLLTAYRPPGSDVLVYAKIKNAIDEGEFNDKDWSLLTYTGGGDVFSDNTNLGDFREYELGFASKPTVSALAGKVSVTDGSPTVTGTGTDFQTDLNEGDYVLITDDGGTDEYQVARVSAEPASATVLTLDDDVVFTNTSASIEKVTLPQSAYLNPQNLDIVRYTDTTGADYDGYKTFALKIVLLSTTTHNIPKIKDIRSISLAV